MKKRIRYSDLGYVARGERARIVPVDHPNVQLNGTWVLTSRVERVQPTALGPVFETEFSVYWPVEQEPMPVTFVEGKVDA